MNDTSPEIEKEMEKRLMSLSGSQRIIMGAGMFDSGREMLLASLSKDLSESEKQEEYFLRMYSNDFSETEIGKIVNHLKKVKRTAKARRDARERKGKTEIRV